MNKWLKGLLSAIIGGAANSITVMVVEPTSFNLQEGLSKLLSVAAVSAIVAAAMYLKQSPLPVEEEPPSIIGNSGMSKLDTMAALSILVILAFVLVGYGCIKPVMKQDTAERIAVSLSAKALGQKLKGDFRWTPQMDAFAAVIEADGVTLSTGQMASNYIMPKIPTLYHREARILFESVGFEFNGSEVVDVSLVDKTLLLEAVVAFKEGLAYSK